MTHDPHRILLDTDIGSDVDDALALGVLLGSPDQAEIVGVTTTYGDTLLRARLAARLASLAGRDVTAVPGARETLSGAPVWWAGHEGANFPDLDRQPVRDDLDAARFLADTVTAAPGAVDLIAIAPLADVASALTLDDRFAPSVRTLYLMGGHFGPDARPEHNIKSDVAAARTVFASGIPTVVTALETTTRLRIEGDRIETIRAAGPLGSALAREIDAWTEFTGEPWSVPHDPMTALTLLRPELFRTETGTVEVADDGLTTFTPDPAGPVRLVVDADIPAVADEIVARIVAADRR